ncbi:aldo/keto reductase [Oceanobacillus oncorhynchi]|uniref:aldo/keto reductase n=1 Tax=Oceanobacillus oncorhynchi TaxID=545501 RepID=UPI001865DA36|nr:aldo/keto reductase [Oceanobacillus oncorhynchi]
MELNSKDLLKVHLNLNNLSAKVALGTFPFKELSEKQIYEIIMKYLYSDRVYIDTAPFYGNRKVEKILGRLITSCNKKTFIASKVGYFRQHNQYQNYNYIYDQVRYSQELLGGKINLLQIHEADWDLWWLSRKDTKSNINHAPIVQVLNKLKQDKEIDFIGITGNNADRLADIAESLDCIDSVLVAKQYDLLWRNGRKRLKKLIEKKGLFYIIGAPFHQGKLLNLEALIAEYTKYDSSKVHEVTKLRRIVEKYDLDIVRTCLEFLLTDPEVDLTLVGAKNLKELWWVDSQIYSLADEIYSEILSIGFTGPPSMGIPFYLDD